MGVVVAMVTAMNVVTSAAASTNVVQPFSAV